MAAISLADMVMYEAEYEEAEAVLQESLVAMPDNACMAPTRERLDRSDALLEEPGTPAQRILFAVAAPLISGWMEGDDRRGIQELQPRLDRARERVAASASAGPTPPSGL